MKNQKQENTEEQSETLKSRETGTTPAERQNRRTLLTVRDIALIGLMTAVIEASKAALSFLPNIELTSFWLILFTLFFQWRIVLVIPVFILIEGFLYGFGIWWLMYLYSWPLLVLLVWIFRKQDSAWFWAVLSGAFGLCFGALCTLSYFLIGVPGGGGLTARLSASFAWWIAGLPWDIAHCVGNFVLMLLLYHPVRRVMRQVEKL